MASSIRLLLSACVIVVLLAACSTPAREVTVGRSHRLLEDSTRSHWSGEGARPIAMTLWYPADANTLETDWSIGPSSTRIWTSDRTQDESLGAD